MTRKSQILEDSDGSMSSESYCDVPHRLGIRAIRHYRNRSSAPPRRPCRKRFTGTALGSFALTLLALAPAALAAPVHPPLQGLSLDGTNKAIFPKDFNKACGTAIDSKGDVYVASAGNGVIDIFNPAHKYLASVADANQPCALAVDSKGNLYATETKTGEVKVVKYVPNAYPFVGTPTYGPPTTVVSEVDGDAPGIAVDLTDDRLYVAEGSRISVYKSDGTFDSVNEVQRVLVYQATGGTFKLSFGGQEIELALAWNATHAEVQAALEGLSTVGVGNVSVTEGNSFYEGRDHIVTFTGALAAADVEQLKADTSGLTGGSNPLIIEGKVNGFSGHIGEGKLVDATGVAARTYKVDSETSDRYVYAADIGTGEIKVFSGPDLRYLKLRKTIGGVDQDGDSKTPNQVFGFGGAGAYLAVDPGNENPATQKCETPVAEQACTAGHLFVYDDAHAMVDEFETNGEFLGQFTTAEFTDAKPTALAVERSGGANDGTIYVTSGAGAGAKLLAFGPLVAPGRPPLPEPLSHQRPNARAVATDSFGDVYVAAETKISVYGPAGNLLTEFADVESAYDLAVDTTGKVYVIDGANHEEEVTYYTPGVYPPVSGTEYTRHEPPCATINSFSRRSVFTNIGGIAVNPASDHVLVSANEPTQILELDSAKQACTILEPDFASSLNIGFPIEIDVYGGNGDVYISANPGKIFIIDPTGSEFVARITGAGSVKGKFLQLGANPRFAVDQSNGHILVFENARGVAEEYEASGTFIAQYGDLQTIGSSQYRIAIDNSGDATDGNVYVAYDEPESGTPDLWAFGPLSYGEPPIAVTGTVDGLGTGSATLSGTVDPRGFEVEGCSFEYIIDAKYGENIGEAEAEGHEEAEAEGYGFEGAGSEECAESSAEIGHGSSPIAVHADLNGLDPEARYHFRLLAKNKYGESEGEARLFGPPVLTIKTALPVLYDEATLLAEINPSGLSTKYHFEYGPSEGEYSQSTPTAELAPGENAVSIQAGLTGLAEGTVYHFRIIAENEAKTVEGPGQALVTLERAPPQVCQNAEYRTGLSANLPDCRAYELVTPAETGGRTPGSAIFGSASLDMNNWLVDPRGDGAGESLAFFTTGTLPGFDGNGIVDGYRAERGVGSHPPAGWTSRLFAPSFAQAGGIDPGQRGVASDQRYSFWEIQSGETFEGTLPPGRYLHTPVGFEPVGKGSLGTDLEAQGRFVSAGGTHVIFGSKAHLEPEAAPSPAEAIYDRAAGTASAEVISVKPDGSTFGENATYISATEDGSAVVFKSDGTLYLHRGGKTIEIAEAPNTFAGVSEDGKRVFYAHSTYLGGTVVPSKLFACDVEAGPCAGAEAHPPSPIGPAESESIFVNVSADGSHVFFTSEEALTGVEENEAGETAELNKYNLYAWDAQTGTSHFIAILDPQDAVGFDVAHQVSTEVNLRAWVRSVGYGEASGRAESPTRSTLDGKVFVFQSHAQLTPYDNTEASADACRDPEEAGERCGEIYRYDAAAATDEKLTCVSCDPSGAPPNAGATLQTTGVPTTLPPVKATNLIPNVIDSGGGVFFQSSDQLLPEDANRVQDVYEWKARETEGCERPGGCLALVSSGQGEADSFLFGMSADGHDVFFNTDEKLVGQDVVGSPSIYDARVEGGIPDPPTRASCQGDACQGQGSSQAALPIPASTGSSNGNVQKGTPKSRCAKGKRKVRRNGKTRCVKKHPKRAHHNRRAGK